MTYLLAQASAHRIPLRDESVQTCVTSPPYWGLRQYTGEQGVMWPDGTTHPLGLEPTPDLFVAHMVEVFREVWRVLRKDGTLWLNLGDSYAQANARGGTSNDAHDGDHHNVGFRSSRYSESATISAKAAGLKPKDLVGIPWRVALALQADGWYLRSDIIWSKPNPMPESVTDRPTKAHEYVYLMSKSDRYYYDADAVREAARYGYSVTTGEGFISAGGDRGSRTVAAGNGGDRNMRTVWQIATQPYPGAHFATFPEALPERCIKAGSAVGDVVLDPFNGSGTTGRVALSLGRRYVGLDMSREYLAEQAIARIDPITHTHRTTDQMALPL